MSRRITRLAAVAVSLVILAPAWPSAGAQTRPLSEAEKIADAMRAAPPLIAHGATIMDWPATAGGEFRLLRAGTNGWTCYPSMAVEKAMCLDREANAWAGAWLSGAQPQLSSLGFGYMLLGDAGASITNPAADRSAAADWHVSGPHVMIFVPDTAHLADLPTDPHSGGPWVMWARTPYAHIMLPVD
ncbi:MAG: hypothetical protein WEA80_07925 [Gemmatimonadaceae bacterium]